jgi:hypothetical protein
MKRIITLGFLAVLSTASATQLLPLPDYLRSQQAFAASPTAGSVPLPRRRAFYQSNRFGFRIVSPRGYIITPSKTKPSTKPATPIQVLEIWQQADFLHRASLPETPPIISITIYNNSKRLPLTHWKGELSRNDHRSLTVAGQNAIAYTSTGLYEYDNVLFSSPDNRYIYRLTAGYADAKAPIRQTFQKIVSSFTFNVSPGPKSGSK